MARAGLLGDWLDTLLGSGDHQQGHRLLEGLGGAEMVGNGLL